MPRKRFAIELGYAADMHGEDMTKAAVRAVRDAISRTCLCGLVEIYGRRHFHGVYVHAEVAVPVPDEVDTEEVLAAIPIGETSISVNPGGMSVAGVEVPSFGPGTSNIVVACAALTVSVDTEIMVEQEDASGNGACGCAGQAPNNS